MIEPLTPVSPARIGTGMTAQDYYQVKKAAAATGKYIKEQQTPFIVEPELRGLRGLFHSDGNGTVFINLDAGPEDRAKILPTVSRELAGFGRCVLAGTLVEMRGEEVISDADYYYRWLYEETPQNDSGVVIYVDDCLYVGENPLADKSWAERRDALNQLPGLAQATKFRLLEITPANTVEDIERAVQEYGSRPSTVGAWVKATSSPYPGQGSQESINWIQYRNLFSFAAQVTAKEGGGRANKYTIALAEAPDLVDLGQVGPTEFQAELSEMVIVTAKQVMQNIADGSMRITEPTVIGLTNGTQPNDKGEVIRAAQRNEIYSEFSQEKAEEEEEEFAIQPGAVGDFVVQLHELNLNETTIGEDKPADAWVRAVMRFILRGEEQAHGFVIDLTDWEHVTDLTDYKGGDLEVVELLDPHVTTWLSAGRRKEYVARPRQAGATDDGYGRFRWYDSGKILITAVKKNQLDFVLQGGILRGTWSLRKKDIKAGISGGAEWTFKRIEEEPKLKSFFGSVPSSAGPRWLSISSAAFRDKENELVTVKAMDSAIGRSHRNKNYGELRVEHYEGSRVGLCDEQFRIGKFLLESGAWDTDARALRAKAAVDKDNEGKIRVSIKFRSFGDIWDGQFNDIEILERSLTTNPINPFTSIRTLREDNMSKSTREKGLREILGDPDAEEILASAGLSEKSEDDVYIKADPSVTPVAVPVIAPKPTPTDPNLIENDPWQPLIQLVEQEENLTLKQQMREAITNLRGKLAQTQPSTTPKPIPSMPESALPKSEMGKAGNADREQLAETQRRRSQKYGISVRDDGNVSIPKEYADMGATEADFADPVNFLYPVWLSKDNPSEEQLGQVRNAPARFVQNKDKYTGVSAKRVNERIQRALKKFKVGDFAQPRKGVKLMSEEKKSEEEAAVTETPVTEMPVTEPVAAEVPSMEPEPEIEEVLVDEALVVEIAKKAAEMLTPTLTEQINAAVAAAIGPLTQAIEDTKKAFEKSATERVQDIARLPKVALFRPTQAVERKVSEEVADAVVKAAQGTIVEEKKEKGERQSPLAESPFYGVLQSNMPD